MGLGPHAHPPGNDTSEKLNLEISQRNDYNNPEYIELLNQLSVIEERLRMEGGYDISVKISKILKGLGFKESDFNKHTSEFSGGWRMRIELAKILSLLDTKVFCKSIDKKSKLGLMLSGGLDSGSIALGFKNLGINDLETFSCNFTHLPKDIINLTDESRFQSLISKRLKYKHNHLPLKGVSPLESIEEYMHIFFEPFHMPNLYIFEKIAISASLK